MHRLPYRLFNLVILSSILGVPIHAQAPADTDTALHAVSYVNVMPSASASMVSALKQYRDASSKENGYVRFDLLQQIGRPGHFAIVETWTNQPAFDAHALTAPAKQFQNALQPIRLSGYDQRLYKTLTIAPGAAAANDQTIQVVTHVDVIPDPKADAPGLLTRLAEASRKEQGNLRFDVLQHTQRANHFTVIETWRSQTSLDAHAAALHTKQYRDTLQPLAGGPLDERLYRSVQ